MRFVLALLFTCGLAWSQIDAPRLGFVRGRDGRVHALHGVAGNFTIGASLMEGVAEAWFDGRRGVARKGDTFVSFDGTGVVTGEASGMPANEIAHLEGDEVVIVASGVRLRVQFLPERIERVAKEYLVVSGGEARSLVRFTPGKEQVYELPEPAE